MNLRNVQPQSSHTLRECWGPKLITPRAIYQAVENGGMKMIASGYSIHLLCDKCEYENAEFGGSEKAIEVWRGVKAVGWKTNKKSRKCLCPACADGMGKKRIATFLKTD